MGTSLDTLNNHYFEEGDFNSPQSPRQKSATGIVGLHCGDPRQLYEHSSGRDELVKEKSS